MILNPYHFSLQRLCCNNNLLCNYDSNVENITEINKKGGIASEDVLQNQQRQQRKGGKSGDVFQDIDILTDQSKKQMIKSAFQGQDEVRAKLYQLAPSALKLELNVLQNYMLNTRFQVISSATLTKGLKIVINALGLTSHISHRD